jgi:hypothetical protein
VPDVGDRAADLVRDLVGDLPPAAPRLDDSWKTDTAVA